MTIAKDGSAIICGQVLKKDEVSVLRTLTSFLEPVTVPEIAKKMPGHFFDTHLHEILLQLLRKPGLILRSEQTLEVRGWTGAKKVAWEGTPEARTYFLQN